eukprot:TRINITY_DN4789_c0_g1_i1.p1 TRINITY_DN4789_c0_g1~~TRINITY_DN4789_c0_g1_i1.p1  ORF type:complete len:281 (-),score=77.80 TRINITY_DN4789_c0_g1_i1:74-916(-)
MFYFVGLGLGNEKDVTVKGKEIVEKCDIVYLEAYTAVFTNTTHEELEQFYNREIIPADRETVESWENVVLSQADKKDIALLVVGDPFCATTHHDLWKRCKKLNIPTKTIHNASIMNAVAETGLELYRFGQTITVVFWTDSWQPDSFYDKIKKNQSVGLHTLCLLDIKVKEPTEDSILSRKKKYLPPRYMTVNQGVEIIKKIEDKRHEGVLHEDSLIVGVARLGYDDQTIAVGTFEEIMNFDFGSPLHCFMLLGDVWDSELEMLLYYAINPESVKNKIVRK